MLNFPSTTTVNKRLPKEAFYNNLAMNAKLKNRFISDIESIEVENSFTAKTLHLSATTEVTEILILQIELKREDYDKQILEVIASQNSHQLIFHLHFHGKSQLAVYYRTIYQSSWIEDDSLVLEANGHNLKEVYESFIAQIALQDETPSESIASKTIDERLQRQADIRALNKQIEKLKTSSRKEIQPKKGFTEYTELQSLQKKLEEIING